MFISLVRLIRNHAALGKSPTRKNQRVRLISKSRKASPENPITGTKYECEGTVDYVNTDSGYGEIRIGVNWDNNHRNIYTMDNLIVSDLPCCPHPYHFKPNFAKDNPNRTFKDRKASLVYHEKNEPYNSINELVMRTNTGKATWL